MLPALPSPQDSDPTRHRFALALREAGFRGEFHTGYAQRLCAGTDNSVYQTLPRAVIFPTGHEDLCVLTRVANRDAFSKLTLTPRGAGTGTNGQSLTEGIVVDLSRHMSKILEINVEQRWARVQPGVVLDQLNRALATHNLRFGPSLSPSNRATLGGMIGTDASGKGSRVYGKTSEHVQALRLVLPDGTQFWSENIPAARKEVALGKLPARAQAIHRELEKICQEHDQEIQAKFVPLRRFLTGYNLAHLQRDGPQGGLNLNPLICGSEGTLAFVTEAKLSLVPTVQHKSLWVLAYSEFQDALASAQSLLSLSPGAIETVDHTILELARKDAIWRGVAPILGQLDAQAIAAINLVELWSSSPEDLATQDRRFQALIDAPDNLARLARKAQTPAQATALWNLRKKGVGLLGATPGERRPVAFVEDSVVPPHKLASYIRDFRAILDAHGLRYGMFGHVDVGCLHVRPALNLRSPHDRETMKRVSDEVQALAARYGGVLWGEHGRGYRSSYTPEFFGPALYHAFRRVKSAFDPSNRLNPGKIATALTSKQPLVPVDALTRGHRDAKISSASMQRFGALVHCNGNAACMNSMPESLMCPSLKVTKDRLHSPKGRAGVMREWLTRLDAHSYDPATLSAISMPKQWQRWLRAPDSRPREQDFSLEVFDAMQGCLSCKACTTLCPIEVDIPTWRAEFLAHFHTRYRRRLRDHLVAAMESGAQRMAAMPGLSRRVMGSTLAKRCLSGLGLIDLPQVSATSLSAALRGHPHKIWSDDALVRSAATAGRCVVIVQDPVTSFYDSDVVVAVTQVIAALGYEPRVLRFAPHGKGLFVQGMIDRFAKVARHQAQRLRRLASFGYELVGIDPAYTLAYRDEYPHVLGASLAPPKVWSLCEWLDKVMPPMPPMRAEPSHASVAYFGHCSQTSLTPQSQAQWVRIFERVGLKLQVMDVGCCGMCGVFGHQREHLDESRGIYAASWEQPIAALQGPAVAPGYSCRSQCARLSGATLEHPAHRLAARLAELSVQDPEHLAPRPQSAVASIA